MPNSYEHSYQHDLDNVIDASDAVLAIGTEKVDTTTLKDRSLNGNDGTIYGAMPSSGYFLGRIFDGDDDYLDCGSSLNLGTDNFVFEFLLNFNSFPYQGTPFSKRQGSIDYIWVITTSSENVNLIIKIGGIEVIKIRSSLYVFSLNKLHHVRFEVDRINASKCKVFVDGIHVTRGTSITSTENLDITNTFQIGAFNKTHYLFDGNISFTSVTKSLNSTSSFNTIARLPLYSHNFERYPNSDTSLTSVFPYTSGIITSGSFNKTDGLKCTSAGQIIFSNSFEFDGSEYITLVIDGVEYSGTTTVTQGTITATIAQGSNDITIDMGTNAVLEDIRVQFREEV